MHNLNQYTAVRPSEPTLIKIINNTRNIHENHPLNKYLRSINMFSQLTMVRAANFKAGGTAAPQRASAYFDNQTIYNMAKALKVEIPKNMGFQEEV